jgi:hypothetical protein
MLNQYNKSSSTLFSVFKNIEDESFKYYVLKKKTDIIDAMKVFFSKEKA